MCEVQILEYLEDYKAVITTEVQQEAAKNVKMENKT